MATAIDSTGVRAVEENGENDRARPRDAAQGYIRERRVRARGFGQPTEIGNHRRGLAGDERASERRERPNRAELQREEQRAGEIDRGHGVTMVVLHGTRFIRYNSD